jgi:hypothetical protein
MLGSVAITHDFPPYLFCQSLLSLSLSLSPFMLQSAETLNKDFGGRQEPEFSELIGEFNLIQRPLVITNSSCFTEHFCCLVSPPVSSGCSRYLMLNMIDFRTAVEPQDTAGMLICRRRWSGSDSMRLLLLSSRTS